MVRTPDMSSWKDPLFRHGKLPALISCALGLMFHSATAVAQAPVVTGVLPAGGPRGAVTTIQIDGHNLADAGVALAGSGVLRRDAVISPGGDRATVEIAVDKDAPLGPVELRLFTRKGISNGFLFWVDNRPNRVIAAMKESDPPLELIASGPAVVNGRIPAAAGRDRFVFSADAGQSWVFQCAASRIRSRLDPVLELKDAAGRMMTLTQGTWESDPTLLFRITKAGKYFLTVRDSEYKGGPDFTYRLTAGVLPFVTRFLPRGHVPSVEFPISLEGVNFGATTARARIFENAGSGENWTEAKLPDGRTVVLPLLAGYMPSKCAPDTEETLLPDVPAIADGVFDTHPVAKLRLRVREKKPLLLDLLGRRIGSRVDGQIRVLDTSGKELASNDDAIGKDARLEFTPPAPGTYLVEVSNVEEKTGPSCYWRLTVEEFPPDFRVELRTDRVNVPAGTTISLPVEVIRTGGFTGPVELSAKLLDGPITSTKVVVPSDKTRGEITLTASAGDLPRINSLPLRIIGTAQISGKSVEHSASGWEQYEHRSIDQVLAKEYTYTRPHYDWDLLLIAVTENRPAFTVNVQPDEVALPPGGKCEFTVKVDRKGANPGAVKLSFQNLPRGVTASVSEIPDGKNEVKITLTAAPDAPAEIPYVIITGTIGNASATSRPLRVAVVK